jgi:hypothetical protein
VFVSFLVMIASMSFSMFSSRRSQNRVLVLEESHATSVSGNFVLLSRRHLFPVRGGGMNLYSSKSGSFCFRPFGMGVL